MKHTLLSAFLFLTSLYLVTAQEIVPLTKQEVMEKVRQDNTTLKIWDQEFLMARAEYRQTNSVFLPNISASHTGIVTTNPLMAFGARLNQEIVTQRDFDPAQLNDPSQIESYATKIEFQQPILNMDGIFQRKAANTKMRAVSLQRERASQHMALEAEKAYMQLQLAHKQVQVLSKALESALQNQKVTENRFEQGYLQQADVLLMEVRITEVKNNLQRANSQVLLASNYLSLLMNRPLSIVYHPTDSLTLSNDRMETYAQVPESRADIAAMLLGTNAQETLTTATKMEFLPKLNAFGSYEFYDDALFQGAASGYLIGAQLRWDIFEGSQRFGKVKKSKAALQQAQLEYDRYVAQSNAELQSALRNLEEARQHVALTQLALAQSKEAYRIRGNRFREGLEKPSDLLISETLYAQKELEYYQAVFDYNYATAALAYLTRE